MEQRGAGQRTCVYPREAEEQHHAVLRVGGHGAPRLPYEVAQGDGGGDGADQPRFQQQLHQPVVRVRGGCEYDARKIEVPEPLHADAEPRRVLPPLREGEAPDIDAALSAAGGEVVQAFGEEAAAHHRHEQAHAEHDGGDEGAPHTEPAAGADVLPCGGGVERHNHRRHHPADAPIAGADGEHGEDGHPPAGGMPAPLVQRERQAPDEDGRGEVEAVGAGFSMQQLRESGDGALGQHHGGDGDGDEGRRGQQVLVAGQRHGAGVDTEEREEGHDERDFRPVAAAVWADAGEAGVSPQDDGEDDQRRAGDEALAGAHPPRPCPLPRGNGKGGERKRAEERQRRFHPVAEVVEEGGGQDEAKWQHGKSITHSSMFYL